MWGSLWGKLSRQEYGQENSPLAPVIALTGRAPPPSGLSGFCGRCAGSPLEPVFFFLQISRGRMQSRRVCIWGLAPSFSLRAQGAALRAGRIAKQFENPALEAGVCGVAQALVARAAGFAFSSEALGRKLGA